MSKGFAWLTTAKHRRDVYPLTYEKFMMSVFMNIHEVGVVRPDWEGMRWGVGVSVVSCDSAQPSPGPAYSQ